MPRLVKLFLLSSLLGKSLLNLKLNKCSLPFKSSFLKQIGLKLFNRDFTNRPEMLMPFIFPDKVVSGLNMEVQTSFNLSKQRHDVRFVIFDFEILLNAMQKLLEFIDISS